MKEKIVDLRKQVIDYLQNELQTPAEYLWKKFPTDAVFRNERNNKWFAAIMNIDFNKIDSSKQGKIDVLAIKCDPFMQGSLLEKPGFYPAYHFNKNNWITILLNGEVPLEQIFKLTNLSYNIVENQK